MLSQSHHLARTTAAATAARYNARPGRRLARTRVAAAVAAAALLASACSTEEPPAPPVAQETTTTITTAPAGTAAPTDPVEPAVTAAPAVTSPCTDPDATDLGDGLVEVDGVVFEVYADACVPRLEEPAGDDDDAPAQDTPSSTTTTVAEPEPNDADASAPSVDIDEAIAAEGEWVGAETDDPTAVVDPIAVEEEGHTIAEPEPEPTPEPEPVTTTTTAPEPEPVTTTTAAPEPEPVTTTTAAPEPEPEPELDLETWRAQMEECRQWRDSSRCADLLPSPLPDCVSGVVFDTPCVMEIGHERSVRGQSLPDCVRGTVLDTSRIEVLRYGTEQSVLSQQNEAWGGTYLDAEDRFFADATSTIGNHPRDHDVDTHRGKVKHPDFPFNVIYDPDALAAIRPAARGDRPQPMPGHRHGHLPSFTPAVQAWSDWCFFDFEVSIVWPEDFDWPDDVAPTPPGSTYFCALGLHSVAFYLSHLEASEDCILPKATRRVEASEQRSLSVFTPSGSPERQAVSEIFRQNSYLHCPNVIYPDPAAVLTAAEHYAIRVRYAGQNGVNFATFVSNMWWDGVEPTQRQYRGSVIGAIPNFVIGG